MKSTKIILTMTFLAGVLMLSANAVYVDAAPGDLLFEINNPNPDENDLFGSSVAMSPDGNILVGAPRDYDVAANSGSVSLFNGTTGDLLWTLYSPLHIPGDYFGESIAFDSDGNFLVGAPVGNNVYLFNGTTNELLLTLDIPGSLRNAYFGSSVAFAPNGSLIVGADGDDIDMQNAGNVFIFNGDTGIFLFELSDPNPEVHKNFGISIASDSHGNVLVGSASKDAYLFDSSNGDLLLTLTDPTPEEYEGIGAKVAFALNGDLLVNAFQDDAFGAEKGSVFRFDSITGELLQTIGTSELNLYSGFGISITPSPVDGNILVGAFSHHTEFVSSGIAYYFDRTTGDLLLTIDNPTPGVYDEFGWSNTITNNGNLVIGAKGDDTGANATGSVYVFEGLSSLEESFCNQPESYYNIINGTDSADYLFGTNNPDLIYGNGGNDIILSKGINNCIYAGDGNDFVLASRDNNTIYGGTGDDSIHIGTGSSAYGESGDDIILISGNLTSSYTVDGGDGTLDVCIVDRQNTSITTENCEITQ